MADIQLGSKYASVKDNFYFLFYVAQFHTCRLYLLIGSLYS